MNSLSIGADRNIDAIDAIKGAYLARRGDATCEQDGAEMKKSLLAFATFVAVTLPTRRSPNSFARRSGPTFMNLS
jgi:hypothetical protein